MQSLNNFDVMTPRFIYQKLRIN